MDYETVFRDEYLSEEDLTSFAYSLNIFLTHAGEETCWCIKKTNHSALKHFSASHRTHPQFKGRDARILSLAILNQFHTEEKPIIVRKHTCQSIYCINPHHYFYGTRGNVQIERRRRSGLNIDLDVVNNVREKRELNPKIWTYRKLSWEFKLPEQTIARICKRQGYDF